MVRKIRHRHFRRLAVRSVMRSSSRLLPHGTRDIYRKPRVTEFFRRAPDADLTVCRQTVRLVIMETTARAQFEGFLAAFGVEYLVGYGAVGANVAGCEGIFGVCEDEALDLKMN